MTKLIDVHCLTISNGERGQEAHSEQGEVTHDVRSQLVVNCLRDRGQRRLILRDMTRYR